MPDWANEALKIAMATAAALLVFVARKLWSTPGRVDKIEQEQASFVREQALAPELARMGAEMDDTKSEIVRLRDRVDSLAKDVARLEGANDGRPSTNRRR